MSINEIHVCLDNDQIQERKQSLTKRQVSQSFSECDNDLTKPLNLQSEPEINVIPPSNIKPRSHARSLLLSMHAGYTSITDEIESYCALYSPPKTPNLLSPPKPLQAIISNGK